MRDERAFDGERGTILTSPDFAELWQEWMPRAAAYCRAFRGLSAEEREDLASEAVLKAWSARSRFDPSRPFAPWFLTILRRLALDQLARRRELDAGQVFAESACSPAREAEDDAMRDAEAAFVRRFVDSLPERDRELASLVYGQGLKVAEAARVAGMPSGSAKWRLFEIRKSLKRAWEREYGETS
jgi:RNA polymerase sigma factor (sigma-70 family)